jgi:hypothetical protein
LNFANLLACLSNPVAVAGEQNSIVEQIPPVVPVPKQISNKLLNNVNNKKNSKTVIKMDGY